MTDAADPAALGAISNVTDATRVVFHPLSMRQNGDSWVIGRMDTGDFIAVPPVAHRATALLGEGRTVGEVAQTLRQDTGIDIAVADFVAALDSLHFLRSLDDQPRSGPAPLEPSLPWLRPQHVRWLLHPVLPWAFAFVVAAAIVTLIANPTLVPSYRDLVWSQRTGIVLVGNAALAWTLTWLHEVGHLATARAVGAPARISLSTRLQFLVVQTDVSGVWAAPRRTRLTVYLAGMAVNVVTASIVVLVLSLVDPHGLTRQLLECVALLSVLFLPFQFLVFMRTDVYFVIQDLAGCTNLYADGSAYVRYLVHCIRHFGRRTSEPPSDPTRALPPYERRAVHAYGWVLLCGTTACITMAIFITFPASIALLAHAIEELAGKSPFGVLDGAAALAVVGGFQIVWMRAWWRRHSERVRGRLPARKHRLSGRR